MSAKKNKTLDDLAFRYQIYPPSGQHKKFRIIKLFKVGGTETIKLSELEKINSDFQNKLIKSDEARERIEILVDKLYAKDGIKKVETVVHPDNVQILNEYWKSEYVPRLKELEDPDTAKYELERAIEALGNCSLRKNSKSELQKTVNKNAQGNKQRRVVVKLNSLLKFIGRDFTLDAAEKEKRQIKYITLEDLPKLLEHLTDVEDVSVDHIRTLHEVAFCTGVLVGEAFALDERSYTPANDTIKVDAQIDKSGKKKETKVNSRVTVALPEGKDAIYRWFQLRKKIPMHLRARISRYTKRAAMQAFKDKSKHISFSDLRHSFAIHLLKKGVPISMVAECIGVAPAYAKETYGSFGLSGSAVEFISKTLKPAS